MSYPEARELERKALLAQLRVAKENERQGEPEAAAPKSGSSSVAFSWDELPTPFPQVPVAVVGAGSAFANKTPSSTSSKPTTTPAVKTDVQPPKPSSKSSSSSTSKPHHDVEEVEPTNYLKPWVPKDKNAAKLREALGKTYGINADFSHPKPYSAAIEPALKPTQSAHKALSVKERAKLFDAQALKRKLEAEGLDENSLKKRSIHDSIGPAVL
eukprot:NODE_5614_length_926_cov_92.623910_g5391_i0.p1 GENE.NODE_5614_length_926_cov_92.623910_g5391_i0~~NODE_5614_length_926_cov_92.623910_g5391_i0.p1  ORF type:complete len:233 (-),score=65.80 NODE_5614_length_926_cov_92.623910_g5391_i0:228-866(-)